MSKKPLAIVGAVVLLVGSGLAITQAQSGGANEDVDSKYNAELAKELGADDYGMRSYVFCTLLTGKTKLEDPEESKKVFSGHFANMGRLAKEGKLVVAGPFVDGAPRRGLYIFNVTTIEDAEALVKTDPAVQAGVFDYELTKLYCSAALMKVGELHEQIQKTPIQ